MGKVSPELKAKVAAVNAANAKMNSIAAELTAALEAEIGQKVFTANGGLTVRFELIFKRLEEKCQPAKLNMVYVAGGVYASTFQTCTVEGATQSHMCDVMIGVVLIDGAEDSLHYRTLGSVLPVPSFRTDYTAEEVQALRDKLKSLRREARSVAAQLGFFGETA